MSHAVDKHRNQQKKVKEGDQETVRKLTQQQLTSAKEKMQGVLGAPGFASKETQDRAIVQKALQVLLNEKQHPTRTAPASTPPALPTYPLPQAAQSQGPPQSWGRGRGAGPHRPGFISRYSGPPANGGRGRNMGNQQPQGYPLTPLQCWGCQQPGHRRSNCPTNPWEEGYQGQERRQV